MDSFIDFRRLAAHCQQMAQSAADKETKEIWIRMSFRWMICADLETRKVHYIGNLKRPEETAPRIGRISDNERTSTPSQSGPVDANVAR